MERKTFGRAGVNLASPTSFDNMQRSNISHAQPIPSSDYDHSDLRDNNRRIAGIICLPLIIPIADIMFTDSELITPLNGTYLWCMRALGAVYSLVVWWFVTQSEHFQAQGIGLFKKVLLWLAAPLFGAGLFDSIAWQLADDWEFAFSKAPYTIASYPITGTRHGLKGARDTLRIDPFKTGESLKIPIPDEQYDNIRLDYKGLCVSVHQRRSASGKIEVKTNRSFTWNVPEPATIRPC